MHRPPQSPVPPVELELSRSADGVFEDLRPRYQPRLTKALIILTVAVFGLEQLQGQRLFEYRWAIEAQAVRNGEWWRLITGAFLHGGVLHLAANAYFGWYIGGRLERYIGPWRLLAITAISLIGSGLLVVAVGQNAVGFSGVLYGWLAAWLGFHLTSRYPALKLGGRQLRAYLEVLGLNLLISLLPFVSFWGHLGGFAAGLVTALALGFTSPSRRPAG